jgi:YHS domain-containing protein
MKRDPVCEVRVNPQKAAAKSERRGETDYICSPVCEKKFDANPE